MIAYTMVGTHNLEKAANFYQGLFSILGMVECWKTDRVVSWLSADDQSASKFCIAYPFDKQQPKPGNGVMTAFYAKDSQTINLLYSIAMKNGAADEGEPGLRPEYGPNLYAAYIRDLDGNKIAFVCFNAEA